MNKTDRKRSIRYYLKEVVIFYLMLVTGVYLAQRLILFHPSNNIHRNPASMGWKYEKVAMEVAGGRTVGWYIPLEDARGTLLFSHGNAGNIADWMGMVPVYRSLGFSVLLYDYGGYGMSTGKVSEARCYADVRAMWKWLTETKGISPEKILIYGQSLGGGVAVDLAREVHPGAVVLESTFTSIPDAAANKLPFLPARWLCAYKFNSAEKIRDINAPIMIIHSLKDSLVPFAHGKRLFELANEPKTFVEIRGGHNDGFAKSKDVYLKAWKQFAGPLFPQP